MKTSMEAQSHPILFAAHQYAALGWRVLPVLGKVPQGGAWQEHATTTDVAGLFGSHRFDGVGVLLGERSGIVDIECDNAEAEATFFRLTGGEIPETPTFNSARGKHFLFRWREGLPPAAVFKVGGLEFRVGNGRAAQSVFPPSAGREWEIGPETPVIDFPAWGEALRLYEESKRPAKSPQQKAVEFTGDTDRLDVPRWLAKNGRQILNSDVAADGSRRWYIECPGIDRHTTANGVRDCCVTQDQSGKLGGCCFHQSCGMRDWPSLRDALGGLSWSDFNEPEISGDQREVDLSGLLVHHAGVNNSKAAPIRRSRATIAPLDESLLMVPGFIEAVVAHNLATARCPQPELAFCGALALLSVLTGRKIQDYSGTRTNVYIVCPAPSGSGKEHARQLNKQLLLRGGEETLKMIGPEGIGSHAGLVTAVQHQESILFQLDEMSDFLAAAADPKKSPHLSLAITKLLQLYSSANTVWVSDALADRKKVAQIDQPHAVVYGTCTPDAFWESITRRTLNGGFVGRLISLEARYATEYIPRAAVNPPQELIDWCAWWGTYGAREGNLGRLECATIAHSAAAKRRIEEQAIEVHRRLPGDDETARALWSRSTERVAKLALLFAASRMNAGCPPVCIDEADADRAIAISNWITRKMLARAEDMVADGDWDGKKKRVLRAIGDGELTQRELSRKTQWLKDRERKEAMSDLIEAGLVEVTEQATATNKRVVIRRV